MKIVSWNSNCRFREKYKVIQRLNADVYVILECENPQRYGDDEFRAYVKNGVWIAGKCDWKGMMIFSPNPQYKIELLDWNNNESKFFIPVRVNDYITIVGVWAAYPYHKNIYNYLSCNDDKLDNNTILIGDFNANVLFDKGKITFKGIVNRLQTKGIEDIYHYTTGLSQGKEQEFTYFDRSRKHEPFHIDHCFCNPQIVREFKIEPHEEWQQYSDHVPISLDIDTDVKRKKRQNNTPQIETLGDKLFWSYANLNMICYALSHRLKRYDRTAFMIRTKAYKAYKEGRWVIHDLLWNNVQKVNSESYCWYCGKEFESKKELTIDHVFPRSKGGSNTMDNIIMVCKHCNSSKGDTDLLEWYFEHNHRFPPIFILAHYLKNIYQYAKENDILTAPLSDIEKKQVPFNHKYIPIEYPQPEAFYNE